MASNGEMDNLGNDIFGEDGAVAAEHKDKFGNDVSESESEPGSPGLDARSDDDLEAVPKELKSSHKKSFVHEPVASKPFLPEQPDASTLDLTELNPLTPHIIARQATINIGTIGHVAHGKSTVVKAISGVQTVRFKTELERNITIKLGYANAKIYKCGNPECPRPGNYRSYKSDKEVDPECERDGCSGHYQLLRHVS